MVLKNTSTVRSTGTALVFLIFIAAVLLSRTRKTLMKSVTLNVCISHTVLIEQLNNIMVDSFVASMQQVSLSASSLPWSYHRKPMMKCQCTTSSSLVDRASREQFKMSRFLFDPCSRRLLGSSTSSTFVSCSRMDRCPGDVQELISAFACLTPFLLP